MRTFEYFINHDERGEFRADVRDLFGQTIFTIEGFEIFEDGVMKNKHDLGGLQDYLLDLGILRPGSELIRGN